MPTNFETCKSIQSKISDVVREKAWARHDENWIYINDTDVPVLNEIEKLISESAKRGYRIAYDYSVSGDKWRGRISRNLNAIKRFYCLAECCDNGYRYVCKTSEPVNIGDYILIPFKSEKSGHVLIQVGRVVRDHVPKAVPPIHEAVAADEGELISAGFSLSGSGYAPPAWWYEEVYESKYHAFELKQNVWKNRREAYNAS